MKSKIKKSQDYTKKTGEIVSFLPYDRHDCACQDELKILRMELSTLNTKEREAYYAKYNGRYTCKRSNQKKMKPYDIVCKNCGAKVAEICSTDKKLTDWCDFHYYLRHDAEHWYGGLTPNVSPIDGWIGIECTCGVDTRDFRNKRGQEKKEKRNKRGRSFAKKTSAFKLKERK